MKKFLNFGLMLALLLTMLMSVTGAALADTTELTVGLYPYVPRLEQFKTAIRTEWNQVHPEISLTFISDIPDEDWDGGYYYDPPENADVYVFDALFFDYFNSQNWLEPIQASEIENLNDFVDYAIDGVQQDGTYYAIPQLGCANVLFYQKNDSAIANATNLDQINDTLGSCTYTSEIPPDRRGLMLDMSGGTTNASLYLDIAHSLNGEYPFPLPWNSGELDDNAIDNMQELLAMASYENGTDSDPFYEIKSYDRGQWFSDGWGRAFVGYTESMSVMSEQTRENIGFKVMPLSQDDESYPAVFYADVIAINPTTNDRGTRDLAVELANVMAASQTMIASIGPDGSGTPQYLMATRPTVFDTLDNSFPLYADMHRLIEDNDPRMFKLNEQSRDWLNAMKDTIRTEAREDYPCDCDRQASQQIPNNYAAPLICNATCANYGGWNGQWTNEYPAAPSGVSVCGCNACNLP